MTPAAALDVVAAGLAPIAANLHALIDTCPPGQRHHVIEYEQQVIRLIDSIQRLRGETQ